MIVPVKSSPRAMLGSRAKLAGPRPRRPRLRECRAVDAGAAHVGRTDHRRRLIEQRGGVPLQRGEGEHRRRLLLARARRLDQLRGDLLGTDLRELVERAEDVGLALHESEVLEHACEQTAVVDPDREALEAERADEVVDHERGLHVAHGAGRPDRVEVALQELAVATPLGVLSAPDGADVVALEGRAEFVDAWRRIAQRNAIRAAPRRGRRTRSGTSGFGLRAALAQQHLGVLERGRVDGRVAVAPVTPFAVSMRRSRGISRSAGSRSLEGSGLDRSCHP